MAYAEENFVESIPANGHVIVETEDLDSWLAYLVQVTVLSNTGTTGDLLVTDAETGTPLLNANNFVSGRVYALGAADNQNNGAARENNRIPWRANGPVRIRVESDLNAARDARIRFWKWTGDHRRDA